MSYEYLYDLESPDHLRQVLVELDTIYETAFGQEISYKVINKIEKNVKKRLAAVKKHLYDQLVQPRTDVAPTGTKQKKAEHKRLWHEVSKR